jgi:hypothetical protein
MPSSSPTRPRAADYANEPLVWDAAFRSKLLGELGSLGAKIEAACGGVPQDVEGVWTEGKAWVVQARPQILPLPTNGEPQGSPLLAAKGLVGGRA